MLIAVALFCMLVFLFVLLGNAFGAVGITMAFALVLVADVVVSLWVPLRISDQ